MFSGWRKERQESWKEPRSVEDERGEARHVSPTWLLSLRPGGEQGGARHAALGWSNLNDGRYSGQVSEFKISRIWNNFHELWELLAKNKMWIEMLWSSTKSCNCHKTCQDCDNYVATLWCYRFSLYQPVMMPSQSARNITDNIGKLETKYWNITNFWAFLIDRHL